MTDAIVLLPDPSERLVGAFREVAARMHSLPVCNAALDVEAVAFAPWEDAWLGVMLTPWCMNLMLLPRDLARWRPLPAGAKRSYRFPAGSYEFVGASDAAIGDYQVCSLFSPLHEFSDHATAALVAQLAREALFDPDNAEASDGAVQSVAASPVSSGPGPLARLEAQLDVPMSKRDFLRARFIGGDRDPRR
jgi:[NiFe] hydrogenase assembly HybE family chaperone